LGLLLFIVYINNLPRHISHFTDFVLFADDTSILITEKNYKNLNQKIRLTLDCNNGWCFKANQLVHNLMETDVIKFSPLHLLQSQLITERDNTTIREVPDTKFLGVQIDNYLNWKCHIDWILLKLSMAGFVIRQLFYVLNLKTLRMAYFAYSHSIIRYGIIFWGTTTNSCKVLKLQKRVIIMYGAEPRASCRGLFRKLEILPVPCQYILSLMLFIIDNPNNFQTSLEILRLHTRSKNQLFIPIANLKSVQKGIAYSGLEIYVSLPSNILNLKNNRKQFKNEFYMYLLNNLFYSLKEFLEFSRDN